MSSCTLMQAMLEGRTPSGQSKSESYLNRKHKIYTIVSESDCVCVYRSNFYVHVAATSIHSQRRFGSRQYLSHVASY